MSQHAHDEWNKFLDRSACISGAVSARVEVVTGAVINSGTRTRQLCPSRFQNIPSVTEYSFYNVVKQVIHVLLLSIICLVNNSQEGP